MIDYEIKVENNGKVYRLMTLEEETLLSLLTRILNNVTRFWTLNSKHHVLPTPFEHIINIS
jgi:hypothetical protein